MSIGYIFSKLIKKMHIPAMKNSNIHKKSKVCSGSTLINVNMGRYSYIGNNCTIVNVNIGQFCSIADNGIIGGANHPIEWVSTSPVFHEGKNILRKNFSKHPFSPYSNTTIGNDVWIGSNCLIKGGITIGSGSIIGMGSVVLKNIGNYEIWAGNPAKLIRKRFNDDVIEKLLAVNWWDDSEAEIMKLADNIGKPEEMIKY